MKKFLMILLPVILLFTILIFLFIPIKQSLVFYDENTNDIEAYLPMESQDTFQIIFTHSIHLTDVVEKYVDLDNQHIQQYEMVGEVLGDVMSSSVVDDEAVGCEAGNYHIKNMEDNCPDVRLGNGSAVSEHRCFFASHHE